MFCVQIKEKCLTLAYHLTLRIGLFIPCFNLFISKIYMGQMEPAINTHPVCLNLLTYLVSCIFSYPLLCETIRILPFY